MSVFLSILPPINTKTATPRTGRWESEMQTKHAKKLKVGDRIQIWAGTPHHCTGTVIETGYSAVKTKWDDGEVGIIHMDDHANVERYDGDGQIIPAKQSA